MKFPRSVGIIDGSGLLELYLLEILRTPEIVNDFSRTLKNAHRLLCVTLTGIT